jgi:hypothetical protein
MSIPYGAHPAVVDVGDGQGFIVHPNFVERDVMAL